MPFCHQQNGIQLYYEERGEGLPIIFVHPPGMGRKVFFYQQLLSEHFRVIFPDLSGHGDTIGRRNPITISGFAEEIKMLLDSLQLEKAIICGYSSGGIVAQEFCLNYPDRVIGVVLAGGFPRVQSSLLKFEHLLGMYFVKHYPQLLAKGIAGAHTNFSPLRAAIVAHMLKADRKVWFQFYEQSLHYSCTERLQYWNKPLLLVYGSKDLYNQHIKDFRNKIAFQTALIKKATHQVPVRNWKIFNQIVTGFAAAHSKQIF